MKKAIFIIIIILVLLGCNSSKENFTEEIKDGITFIRNKRIPVSDIRLEAELVIGDEDKEEEIFSQISDIKEDKNGNIYIVDRKNHEIKVFSYEGRYIRTIGNKGEGPGEFNEPENIGFIDDKILVSDTQNQRFQIFDFNGNFIESKKLENDKPESFAISSNNRIFNKSISFSFSFDEEKSENFLFRIYDRDFKKTNEFGAVKEFKDPFETYIMNRSSFVLDSQDRVIVNYHIENRIAIYENQKLISQIERELFFTPKKPDIKSTGSNDSYSFNANYEPVSYDLAVDTNDNIYILTVYKIKPEEEHNYSPIIEVFEKSGVLKQVVPVPEMAATKIYINKENKIYLVDSNEMKVIRFKAII